MAKSRRNGKRNGERKRRRERRKRRGGGGRDNRKKFDVRSGTFTEENRGGGVGGRGERRGGGRGGREGEKGVVVDGVGGFWVVCWCIFVLVFEGYLRERQKKRE